MQTCEEVVGIPIGNLGIFRKMLHLIQAKNLAFLLLSLTFLLCMT